MDLSAIGRAAAEEAESVSGHAEDAVRVSPSARALTPPIEELQER